VRYPISLWLEVESRCNLACRFCYNFWRPQPEGYPEQLSTEQLLRGLTSLLDQFECRRVAISGGEPLLRTDLEEIVAFFKRRQVQVILTTNGALLSDDKVDALRDCGVDIVQVSLHSSKASEHDWLSSGDAFRAAVLGLMRVRERGVGVAAVFVATSRNLWQFPDTLQLLADIDVRTIIFNRFIVSGLGISNRDKLGVPEDAAVLQMLRAAQSVAETHGQTIVMGTPVMTDPATRHILPSARFGSCPVRRRQTRWTIGVDGAIRRCNHSPVAVGNILTGGILELTKIYAGQGDSISAEPNCGRCQLDNAYFRQIPAASALASSIRPS
jgi:MoaA/NifB/PqqE/SkfB family radical SAM enzyme